MILSKDAVKCVTLLPVPDIDMLPIHLEEQARITALVLVAHTMDPTAMPVSIDDIFRRLNGTVGSTDDRLSNCPSQYKFAQMAAAPSRFYVPE